MTHYIFVNIFITNNRKNSLCFKLKKVKITQLRNPKVTATRTKTKAYARQFHFLYYSNLFPAIIYHWIDISDSLSMHYANSCYFVFVVLIKLLTGRDSAVPCRTAPDILNLIHAHLLRPLLPDCANNINFNLAESAFLDTWQLNHLRVHAKKDEQCNLNSAKVSELLAELMGSDLFRFGGPSSLLWVRPARLLVCYVQVLP